MFLKIHTKNNYIRKKWPNKMNLYYIFSYKIKKACIKMVQTINNKKQNWSGF